MSRFYQTTQRNFVDDFIFEPDMELAKEALIKKDNDVKAQIAVMDLFENLPIDYWEEADGENAARIKNEYADRVAEVASQMQKDITNTGSNQRLINSLRRDIAHDWEFGDISKIQKNAQAYREFDERLKALPNPADRDAYRKQIQNYIESTGGRGALENVFKPDELFNSRNIMTEFTDSSLFKSLNPDEKSSQITNEGGRWMVTNSSGKTELSQSKIGQAFKAFLEGENLGGYGDSRQKYFGEQWKDENGNLRMDQGSYLGDLMAQGIPALAYSKSTTGRSLETNQYAFANHNAALQEAATIRDEKRAAVANAQKSMENMAETDLPDLISANTFLQERLKSFILPAARGLGGNESYATQKKIFKEIIAGKYKGGYPEITAKAKQFAEELKQAQIASRAPIFNYYGGDKGKTDTFFENVGSFAKHGNVKHYIDQAGDENLRGGNNYTFNELNSGKILIKKHKIVPGSVTIDHKNAAVGMVVGGGLQDGMTAIPFTYKVKQLAKKGGQDEEDEYIEVEKTDYMYSQTKNYIKDRTNL